MYSFKQQRKKFEPHLETGLSEFLPPGSQFWIWPIAALPVKSSSLALCCFQFHCLRTAVSLLYFLLSFLLLLSLVLISEQSIIKGCNINMQNLVLKLMFIHLHVSNMLYKNIKNKLTAASRSISLSLRCICSMVCSHCSIKFCRSWWAFRKSSAVLSNSICAVNVSVVSCSSTCFFCLDSSVSLSILKDNSWNSTKRNL